MHEHLAGLEDQPARMRVVERRAAHPKTRTLRGAHVTTAPAVWVEIGGNVYSLADGQRITFGRSRHCTVCLDPEDQYISRLAGTIESDRGIWWVSNMSSSRPLAIIDDFGFRSVLPPRRRTAAENTKQIVVDGTNGRHRLTVTLAEARGAEPQPPQPAGPSTANATEVLFTATDRLALVAMFAEYLDNPTGQAPQPKRYAAAAARLGWKRTTLIKRVEYLRMRLDAAGVPQMHGPAALTHLAEYAISRRIITPADLAMLRR